MTKDISFKAVFKASLIIVAFISLIGLGTWQLQRLAWKTELISVVEESLNSKAITWFEGDTYVEYSHVEITGTYDHSKELYLHAIDNNGKPGFHIYTPFHSVGGRVFIINRGFVPVRNLALETRPEGQTEGEISIKGVLRKSTVKKYFIPENDIAENRWFYADMNAMANAAGLDSHNVFPLFLEADLNSNQGNIPNGGAGRVNIVNNHLGYAVTWYGLALALLVVVYIYRRNKKIKLVEEN